MGYAVELSDDAAATIGRLPVDVAICISENLERLTDDSLGLSRRPAFPYRPVGQIFEFWCGREYFITALFHYKPG